MGSHTCGCLSNKKVDVLAKKLVRDRVEVPVRERRGRSKRIHLHCRPPAREILKPILVVSSSERGLHKYKRVRITGGHSGIILDETVNKLHNKMIKALSSIFIQMRSGKIRLNNYLHKMKRADEPGCPYGRHNQTITHIVGDCPYFRRQTKISWISNNPRSHSQTR
jgi:hypothetical protein